MDDATYSEELSNGLVVEFFEVKQLVEIRQGSDQSVTFHYEDLDPLIDTLMLVRDEEY